MSSLTAIAARHGVALDGDTRSHKRIDPRTQRSMAEMIGARFGRLTVVSGPVRRCGVLGFWVCACECGGETVTTRLKLRSGHTGSCGCLREELRSSYSTQVNIERRFWSRVNKDGPIPAHVPDLGACWVWTGATSTAGYGQMRANKKTQLAPRVSWLIATGSAPRLLVCHKCDNPPCVNPRHLFEGSVRDNALDMVAKGRARGGNLRGGRHGNAKMTDALVAEVLRRASTPDTTQSEVARQLGLPQQTVNKIVRRKIWKHVQVET
jgi:hypothetical protein